MGGLGVYKYRTWGRSCCSKKCHGTTFRGARDGTVVSTIYPVKAAVFIIKPSSYYLGLQHSICSAVSGVVELHGAPPAAKSQMQSRRS